MNQRKKMKELIANNNVVDKVHVIDGYTDKWKRF